jgi:ribose/xylose/arabinose/galactoside ABC-type transport system permease subunit
MKKLITTLALGFIVLGLASCCSTGTALSVIPEGPVVIEK